MVFAVLLSWKTLCSLQVEEIFMHSMVLMRPAEPGREPLTIHIASLGVGHGALVRNCSVFYLLSSSEGRPGFLKTPSVLKTAQVLKPSSECHSRYRYSLWAMPRKERLVGFGEQNYTGTSKTGEQR